MSSLFALTDKQWTKIEKVLAKYKSPQGKPVTNGRDFVNGVLWVLRSGARWIDLPKRFGKFKTVHKCFTRWCERGIFHDIFDILIKDKNNKHLKIDRELVKIQRYSLTFKDKDRRWGV